MSGAPSANKRQRPNAMGTAAVSGAIDYLSLIRSLPAQTMCNILLHAAQLHPDVGKSIVKERSKILAAEQAKTIDFDHFSKSAWKAMNAKFSRASGSRKYKKSHLPSYDKLWHYEVRDCINEIGNATPAHASFGTKKSALETLRKIGKSISMSISMCEGDTLESELIKQWQYDDCLESTMLRIAKSLTVEERAAIMTQEFLDRLVELESLGAGRCLFEQLKDVRSVLLGKKDSE